MKYDLSWDDEIIVPHKLLLANKQVSNRHKGFEKNLAANIKLSKVQPSNIVPWDGIFDRRIMRSLKIRLILMKTVLQQLDESALISIRINSSSISKKCNNLKENSFIYNSDVYKK